MPFSAKNSTLLVSLSTIFTKYSIYLKRFFTKFSRKNRFSNFVLSKRARPIRWWYYSPMFWKFISLPSCSLCHLVRRYFNFTKIFRLGRNLQTRKLESSPLEFTLERNNTCQCSGTYLWEICRRAFETWIQPSVRFETRCYIQRRDRYWWKTRFYSSFLGMPKTFVKTMNSGMLAKFLSSLTNSILPI